MNKAINVFIALVVPMVVLKIAQVLAYGLRGLNTSSGILAGLRMIGFRNAQTGIIVMMLLSLITYLVAEEMIKERSK